MKKNQYNEPVDYWDSLADGMVALFLIILLIVLLFILYFSRSIPYNAYVDDTLGDDTADYNEPAPTPTDTHQYDNSETGKADEEIIIIESGGGGGEEEPHEEEPLPGGEGYGDEGEKSAVFVEVVDGETLLPIAREGIEFELYDSTMRLQRLNDYYPARVEHTRFETTETGQFYLPEKIYEGDYIFRALTAVEGYAPADDTPFSLSAYYDWESPFCVTIAMYPLRSSITVRLVDKSTGDPVAGGSFQVFAADNIVTLDGTIRHRVGDLVDTFEIDANGRGESIALYFGKYLLRQVQVPEFYGLISGDVPTEVLEENGVSETIQVEKTTMVLTLRDALYDDITLPGAEFTLSGGTRPSETLVTDAAGQIILTNLQKSTTYTLRQTSASSKYQMDTSEHSFTVDGTGLIRGAVHQEMFIENRTTRASFTVTGTLLGTRVSDVRMVLQDEQGVIVGQWTTSGQDEVITGLAPGSYRLIIGGAVDDPVEVYISDEIQMQQFSYRHWTLMDTAIVGGGGFAVLGMLALIIFIALRRRKRSRRGAKS